jgi:hypothetical protein
MIVSGNSVFGNLAGISVGAIRVPENSHIPVNHHRSDMNHNSYFMSIRYGSQWDMVRGYGAEGKTGKTKCSQAW